MVRKCRLCGVTKNFEHLGRDICEKCFVRLIEKRVKKSLGRIFSKGNKVLVVGDLAEYFLRKSVKNLPLKIVKRKEIPSDVSNFDKIVVEETIDDVDAEFLSGFFSKQFVFKKNKKIIKILKSITDEEAVKFAEIKGVGFEVKKENKAIKEFLKKISKKHPEVRFNLLKNVKGVEGLLN